MVIVIKLIDKYIGRFLCNILAVLNSKRHIDEKVIKKILVVQLWGIGETILTLPAIDALKKKFPKTDIDVLATSRNKDVFYKNRNINNIFTLRLNPFSIIGFIFKNLKKYQIVIDMEEYLNISAIISFFVGIKIIGYSHDARAKLYSIKVKYDDNQHAVQTFFDLVKSLGVHYDADSLPKLNYSKNDKNFVDKFLKECSIKTSDYVICIAPGAAESAKSRMWPYDRYAEFCDEMIPRFKARIIFVGSLNENELIEKIQKNMENKNTVNASGKMTLNQLFYLIGKSKLFVGNDAGPMHVASAQGVKTLGLFGPNLPVRFGPYGKGNIGLYKGNNCEFSPCINVHKGQVPDCLYPKSSNDYQKCMKNISVNDVLKEVEKLV